MSSRMLHLIRARSLVAALLLSGCLAGPAPESAPTFEPSTKMTFTLTPAPTTNSALFSTPTPAVTVAPSLAPFPADGLLRVGYYPYWAASELGNLDERLPQGSLFYLNYAFALPSDKGECVSANASADAAGFPALARLKKNHPSLQTLISVGGWGTEKLFDTVVVSDASRARFASSCAAFMRANGFDGIDLDWEYPRPEQKEAFTALLAELRRALNTLGQANGRIYLLTIAAPAGPWQISNLELDRIHPYLDWINLMTYDFYGSWSPSTGLNAPLYNTPGDPLQLSVDTTVQAYLEGGGTT